MALGAGAAMGRGDSRESYRRAVQRLLRTTNDKAAAMEQAVGGQFEAIGLLERQVLIHYGLQRDDYLIDVGCGSGRLAKPLSQYLQGKYLGIDIDSNLVEYARSLVQRPNWHFKVTNGFKIPEADGVAD